MKLVKFFFKYLFKLLFFLGVPKDIIKWIEFNFGLCNGLILSYLGREVDERIAEYLWLLRNLRKTKAKVLDVGCSGTLLSYALLRKGYDVYGVDYRSYPEGPEKIKFYKQDIRSLPFEDNFFDLIVAISALEHFGMGGFGDPVYEKGDFEAIKELERILKTGGEIFLTVPFAHQYAVTWQRFYNRDKILELTKKLLIIKEEFYKRDTGGWAKIGFDEIKNIPASPKVNVVACLVLRKG